MVDAFGRIQPTIEFDPQGNILTANQAFLDAVGYTLEQIAGRHHTIFCLPEFADSGEYHAFWQALMEGGCAQGQFERVHKDGRPIWLQASYNPILGADGTVSRIVQFANDISAEKLRQADMDAKMMAIDAVQAVIEFGLDGSILHANANFLTTFGYTLTEVVGQAHRMFCERADAASPAYKQFWDELRAGHRHTGEFKRLAKDGSEVWIQASYNPVVGPNGRPIKFIKFATDITMQKRKQVDSNGKVDAVERVQAVIEFDLKGRILRANENFLATFGYASEEVVGQHHRLFCDPLYVRSPEYLKFWEHLGQGEFNAGEFRRIAKNGAEVWIQASYNPIFDPDGKLVKVVKFATDITPIKLMSTETMGKLAAISRSQAIIEFDIQGNILDANKNFLRTVGYTLAEVSGRHHSMFCEPAFVQSAHYRNFWADLGEGIYKSARFVRLGKHGAQVWLQATYNPILDVHGKPYKVVKFAVDITEQVMREQLVQKKIQDITAVLADLSSSIATISRNSQHSRDLALQTQQEAKDGNDLLDQSRSAILEIQKSSQDVYEIIGTIGDIASQTHLLAFNAAIEAARAGPQGLGFSVVADEVRKLAEKSARAAHAISKLITETIDRVNEGGSISAQVKDAFDQIECSVGTTTESIAQIYEATTEQAEASRHVGRLLVDLRESSVQP